jgi:rhodanese-related sulfurtransferase
LVATPLEATPEDAFAAMERDSAVLIDVRQPWENDQLRIPGAVLIPMNEVPDRLAEIPEDRDVYVHCAVGARSAKVVEFLRGHGRARAINVTGGIDGWKEAGLPVTS